jgi:predicted metal-dependent hydrolase
MLGRMSLLLRRSQSPRAARTQQREVIDVTLPDGRLVAVLRVRDPRARHTRLLVSESGARLTLPLRASLREADQFLRAHLGWLADQLDRRVPEPELLPFVRDEQSLLPLRGERLPIVWRDGRALGVARVDDTLFITAPPLVRDASLRRALKDFYLAEARRDIGRWLPKYLHALPRAPRVVTVRALKSLWGSLSPSDGVSLDLALVLGPPAAFEYVLVHELCHLIQPNHSRAFWREVERRCPEWRAQRGWFRAEGLAMKRELARLIAR